MPKGKKKFVDYEGDGDGIIFDIGSFFLGYPGEKPIKQLIADHGKATIKSIVVARDPIKGALNFGLNVLTFGQLQKAVAEKGYDRLFHLFMVITLSDGYVFKLEKNEKVSLGTPTFQNDTEKMNVPINKQIELGHFLGNAMKTLKKNFWYYNAFSTNCQHFISQLLLINGFLTGDLRRFIMQDAAGLLKDLPSYTSGLANIATDIAAVASRLNPFSGGSLNLNDNLKRASSSSSSSLSDEKMPHMSSLAKYQLKMDQLLNDHKLPKSKCMKGGSVKNISDQAAYEIAMDKLNNKGKIIKKK